jgi:ferredoxin--NADP+ reductase
MHTIRSKERLAENIYRIWVDAPRIAKKAKAGQFAILRVNEEGERIPLTIADTKPEEAMVALIYQVVGYSTRLLEQLEVGDALSDLTGPLGHPSKLEGVRRALCVGGGVGTAVVYPTAKALYAQGSRVDVVVGARNRDLVILEKELQDISEHLYITTDDGSYGQKGFVTDVVKALLEAGEDYDEVIAIGPPIMMKMVCEATRPFSVKTIVSMNPIMIDGTGMCGCCRLTVNGELKYGCVDGPEFDGHEVDFDEFIRRGRQYRNEEMQMNERPLQGGHCACHQS